MVTFVICRSIRAWPAVDRRTSGVRATCVVPPSWTEWISLSFGSGENNRSISLSPNNIFVSTITVFLPTKIETLLSDCVEYLSHITVKRFCDWRSLNTMLAYSIAAGRTTMHVTNYESCILETSGVNRATRNYRRRSLPCLIYHWQLVDDDLYVTSSSQRTPLAQ